MKLALFVMLVVGLYLLYRKFFSPQSPPQNTRDDSTSTPATPPSEVPEADVVSHASEAADSPQVSSAEKAEQPLAEATPIVLGPPIEELKTLSRQQARIMRAHSVVSITDLATVSDEQLQTLSQALQVSDAQLQGWQQAAGLMHKQPAIDAGHALLLQSLGCHTLEQLKAYSPEQLQALLNVRNSQQRHVRVLATSRTIERWQAASA